MYNRFHVSLIFLLAFWLRSVHCGCSTVNCESQKSKYSQCNVANAPSGKVRTITFVEQESKSACTEGVSYGFIARGIWVNKGCRANFDVCYTIVTTKATTPTSTHVTTKGTITTTEATTQTTTELTTETTTEATSTVSQGTTDTNIVCQCPCSILNRGNLSNLLDEIVTFRENLLVDKTKLSSTERKFISVYEDRLFPKITTAVIFVPLSLIFLLLFVQDILRVLSFVFELLKARK